MNENQKLIDAIIEALPSATHEELLFVYYYLIR